MIKIQIFNLEEEAIKFASEHNGAISKMETESFLLPAEFWQKLSTSQLPFVQAIRHHADVAWGGSLESAWQDALEGKIRGIPASAMLELDSKFRALVVSTTWMVEYDDGEPEPYFRSASIDAGMPGNEDGAWGSSTSDGWLVD